MIRTAVFLTAHDLRVLLAELDDPYEPTYRSARARKVSDAVALRDKIQEVLRSGANVIIEPDALEEIDWQRDDKLREPNPLPNKRRRRDGL